MTDGLAFFLITEYLCFHLSWHAPWLRDKGGGGGSRGGDYPFFDKTQLNSPIILY